MRKHMAVFILGLLIVAGLLVVTVFYQVDYNEVALIKTFGKTTRVISGPTEAGPGFKWPWPIERLVRYDAGWHVFADPATELQLYDRYNVIVALTCNWRIDPQHPEDFNRKAETVKGAEEAIRNILQSFKGDVLGKQKMSNLVNTDPHAMQLAQIEKTILDRASAKLKEDGYGIELERVSISGLGLSDNVAKAVIDAQITERKGAIRNFESEGESAASAIRARAQASADQIMKFAERKAELIKAEGILSAAKYYGTFKQAPELSAFLRTVEGLKAEMKNRAVIVLDPAQLPGLNLFRFETDQVDLLNPLIKAPASQPTTQSAGEVTHKNSPANAIH